MSALFFRNNHLDCILFLSAQETGYDFQYQHDNHNHRSHNNITDHTGRAEHGNSVQGICKSVDTVINNAEQAEQNI